MATQICQQCGQKKDVSKFKNSWGVPGFTRKVCKACYGDRERARLKLDMLNAFGRECDCCGEKHPEFLSLEHRIPGNGQTGTGLKSHQLYRIARREGWPKKKYACLCMNCNYAKGHYGYCPHEMKLSIKNWYQRYEHLARHPKRDYSIVTEAQRRGLALGPKAGRAQAHAAWEAQMKRKAEDPNYYRQLSSKEKKALRRQTYRYQAP